MDRPGLPGIAQHTQKVVSLLNGLKRHCYLSINAWLHCVRICGDSCTRSLPAILAAAHAVWAVSDSCVAFIV